VTLIRSDLLSIVRRVIVNWSVSKNQKGSLIKVAHASYCTFYICIYIDFTRELYNNTSVKYTAVKMLMLMLLWTIVISNEKYGLWIACVGSSREMEMFCLILNYFYCLTILYDIHYTIVRRVIPWENKLVLMSLLT